MRFRFQILLALMILAIGIAGQISYDFYFRPYVLAKKVLVASQDIPQNKVIAAEDLVLKSVPNELIPREAIFDTRAVVGKVAIVTVSRGSVLTFPMIDMDDLYPGEGEVIFPVPKEAIYAVNGSLRKRDLVDISLFREIKEPSSETPDPSPRTIVPYPFLEKIPVVFVRTDDNQSVKDTESGDNNQRETSTGRIATVELLLTKEQRDILIEKIAEGNKLWLTRVAL